MRIGVYGNVANNAYIHTRLLRGLGHDAEVILDPFDRFAMSDPRWEDLELELPSHQLTADALPETELPRWVRNSAGGTRSALSRRRRAASAAARHPHALKTAWQVAGSSGLAYAGAQAAIVEMLSRYDCAIVYGLGPIVAALARIPFVTLPFGGDITIIPFSDGDGWQGQCEPGTRPPSGSEPQIAALQRHGLRRTNRILVCDPAFGHYIDQLGLSDKSVAMGLPIDTDMYSPELDAELRTELLRGADARVVFVPARQDWYWKGSNLMLEGYALAAAHREDVVLVCAGWGADVEKSRRLIADLGIGARVRLLEHAMSKPRLLRYYRAADIVMDQFTFGSYGGSALEAMSCARPVVMYLDPSRFESRFDDLPPVVNAREPNEIAARLAPLLDNPELRARVGARAREWVIANHGPPAIERMAEICRAAAAEGLRT